MITAWTENLKTQEERDRFEDGLRHAKWLLSRLGELLDKIQRGILQTERSPKNYDKPNWEYRQAHANGYLQCLNDIKNLINLDHKESNDRQLT